MNAVLEMPDNSLMPETSTLPAATPAPVATLTNITKRYANGVVALGDQSGAGLSLSLRPGEIVALLGPNGAGKSTAVKLMLGLSTPTSGEVRIFGRDPRDSAARIKTGAMLQVGRAPEMLRVREHIAIFRGYYPHPMPYAEIIKAAGLEGIENRMFGELSGGQKQRVLFGLALAGDPDLIFLDEPTVGLDIEARRGLWAQIRSLAARGKTVLLTTHYLEEADALAHRIIVVNKGKVICEGTPAEVKAMGAGSVAGGKATGTVRIIRCATSLPLDTLRALAGVTTTETSGGLATVTTTETSGGLATVTTTRPEAALREMLALDLNLHSLEVASPALEDAFLALTSDEVLGARG